MVPRLMYCDNCGAVYADTYGRSLPMSLVCNTCGECAVFYPLERRKKEREFNRYKEERD